MSQVVKHLELANIEAIHLLFKNTSILKKIDTKGLYQVCFGAFPLSILTYTAAQ